MNASSTLVFYVCVDIIAVLFLACADNMVSERRRVLLQTDSRYSLFSDRNFVITVRHLCFFVSFSVLFIVSAFRNHVGIDYNLYAHTYLRITSGLPVNEHWLSTGFIFLCRFLGMFAPRDYEVMFAVIAFFTLYFFYKSIYKMSCSWWLSLYIFLCFCLFYNTLGQPRQFLAIAITVYACSFLYKKENGQKKYFLLYVYIAFLFHKSALIVLPLYFCHNFRMSKRNLFLYVLLIATLNIGYSYVLRFISLTSYASYVGSVFDISMKQTTIMNATMRVLMLAGCLMFAKRTVRRNPNTLVFYNSAVICTILTVMSTRMALVARMTQYFFVMYIFLVPEVLKSVQSLLTSESKKTMLLIVLLLFGIYHFAYYHLTGGGNYHIYRFL